MCNCSTSRVAYLRDPIPRAFAIASSNFCSVKKAKKKKTKKQKIKNKNTKIIKSKITKNIKTVCCDQERDFEAKSEKTRTRSLDEVHMDSVVVKKNKTSAMSYESRLERETHQCGDLRF